MISDHTYKCTLAPNEMFRRIRCSKTRLLENTCIEVSTGQIGLLLMNGRVSGTLDCGFYRRNSNKDYVFDEFISKLSGRRINPIIDVCYVSTAVFGGLAFHTRHRGEVTCFGTDHNFSESRTIPLHMSASGFYVIKIQDPKLFFFRNVQSGERFFVEMLQESIERLIQSILRTNIAACLKQYKTDILSINTYLDDVEDASRKQLEDALRGVGLKLVSFSMEDMEPVDEEEYRFLKNLRTSELEVQESIYLEDITRRMRNISFKDEWNHELEMEKARNGFYMAQMYAAYGANPEYMGYIGRFRRPHPEYDYRRSAERYESSENFTYGKKQDADTGRESGHVYEVIIPKTHREDDGQIICPRCGTRHPNTAKYCMSCGKALNIASIYP